jgi:hypothetical protein
MQQRLWRLLGDCERLARDETAALTHRNFPALFQAQQVKAALLADLASEANVFHASGNSPARARLEKLLETTRHNASLVSGMMDDTRVKRRKIRAALRQLQALRVVYKSRRHPARESLSAHV